MPTSTRPAPRLGPVARLRVALLRLRRRPGPGPAALVGLLSTLLPCGWLWSFVVLAAAAGSALSGALTMATFWIGTVPALAALGFIARRVSMPLRRRAPVFTAAALLVAGGVALFGKLPAAPAAGDAAAEVAPPPCHGHHP